MRGDNGGTCMIPPLLFAPRGHTTPGPTTATIMSPTNSNSTSLSLNNEDDEEENGEDESAGPTTVIFKYMSIPSALLSTICSLLVVYHIFICWRRKKNSSGNGSRRNHQSAASGFASQATFYRFLLGLCVYDVMSSTTYILEPFATQLIAGHWTCTTSGFFKFTGVGGASLYNAGISLFSFLVVCRQWRQADLVHTFEPYYHLGVALLLVWSLVGIPLEVYNPVVTDGCWAGAYPKDCAGGDDCQRAPKFGPIYALEAIIVLLLIMTILIVTHVSIFCTVRRQEQRIHRYRFHGTTTTSESTNTNTNNPNATTTNNNHTSNNKQQQQSSYTKTRQVATRSILYCAGFFACYLPALIQYVVTQGNDHWDQTWFLLLHGIQEILFPLQGFFNCVVYLKPKYVTWKKILENYSNNSTEEEDNKNNNFGGGKNRWLAFQMTIRAQDIAQYKQQQQQRSTTMGAAYAYNGGQNSNPNSVVAVEGDYKEDDNDDVEIGGDDNKTTTVAASEDDKEKISNNKEMITAAAAGSTTEQAIIISQQSVTTASTGGATNNATDHWKDTSASVNSFFGD